MGKDKKPETIKEILQDIMKRDKLFERAYAGDADALIFLGRLYLAQTENGIKKNDRKK